MAEVAALRLDLCGPDCQWPESERSRTLNEWNPNLAFSLLLIDHRRTDCKKKIREIKNFNNFEINDNGWLLKARKFLKKVKNSSSDRFIKIASQQLTQFDESTNSDDRIDTFFGIEFLQIYIYMLTSGWFTKMQHSEILSDHELFDSRLLATGTTRRNFATDRRTDRLATDAMDFKTKNHNLKISPK